MSPTFVQVLAILEAYWTAGQTLNHGIDPTSIGAEPTHRRHQAGTAFEVTFANGVSDLTYEGQITILNDTTGENTLLRIDSDGLIKQ